MSNNVVSDVYCNSIFLKTYLAINRCWPRLD